MQTKILSLLLVAGPALANVDPNLTPMVEKKSFQSDVTTGLIKGLGDVRVRVDRRQEPVQSPVAVTVDISCGKSPAFQTVLSDFRTCDFTDIVFDKEVKGLVLSVKTYDPDTGKCSGTAAKVVALKGLCPQVR